MADMGEAHNNRDSLEMRIAINFFHSRVERKELYLTQRGAEPEEHEESEYPNYIGLSKANNVKFYKSIDGFFI